jgi:hypothetical protein
MFLNAGYRHRPTRIDNAGIDANDSPAVARNTEGTNRVANVNYDWFINSRTTTTVTYVRMDEQSETVPVTDLGFQPTFDPNNLTKMGRITINGISQGSYEYRLNRQNYYRDEIKADLTHLLDVGSTQHQIKTGFGWDQGVEDLTRLSNGWGPAEQRDRQRPEPDPRKLLPRTADAALEGPVVLVLRAGRHDAQFETDRQRRPAHEP